MSNWMKVLLSFAIAVALISMVLLNPIILGGILILLLVCIIAAIIYNEFFN